MLTDLLIYAIPALICITVHEVSHGLTAYYLGDPTAKRAGRLSLNPIRHIDWIGLAMLVVFHFGWAKPVPVDMRNFRQPKRDMAITALAGPVSNFLLTLVFLILYGVLYVPLMRSGSAVGYFFLRILLTTAFLSTSLGIFNLLPVSPLDGSKVLFAFLSDRGYFTLMRYERLGMILMVVLVATGVLGVPLSRLTSAVFDGMMHVAVWISGLLWG